MVAGLLCPPLTAWLSIPAFARPPGAFTYEQRMGILECAYAGTDASRPVTTAWLVVTVEARPSRSGRCSPCCLQVLSEGPDPGVARDGLRPGTATMALANLDEMAFVGCFSTNACRWCANVEKSRAQSSEDRDGGYDEKAQRVAVR
jgi:hypothetical protein